MAAIRQRRNEQRGSGDPQAEMKAQAAREAQRRTDYQITFGTESGQRVLADIVLRCQVCQTVFKPGQPDLSAFDAGRQRVALEIIETVTSDPEAPMRMVLANNTEELFREF